MSSTTQETPQQAQPIPQIADPAVKSVLEIATKNATLLVVASYAIGYLIVTINDNAHGFLETSLIKPRAITAGAIFILLTALPISLTQGTFFGGGSEPESRLETFTRLLLGLLDYVTACSASALVALMVLTDDLHGQSMMLDKGVAFATFMSVIALNGLTRFAAPKFYRHGPRAWIVFSVVCLGGLAVGAYHLRGFAIMRALIWSFAISTLVNPYLSDMRRGIKLKFKVTALAGC